jgi:hypothetical protein
MDIHTALTSLLQAMLPYKPQAGNLEQLLTLNEDAEQTAQSPHTVRLTIGGRIGTKKAI